MKKRFFAVIIVLLLLLSACAAETFPSPVRGTWEGRVYTSRFLGLSITVPANWDISTRAELAEMSGLTIFSMPHDGHPINSLAWESANDEMIYEFHIVCNLSLSSAQIEFGRISGETRGPSETEFLRMMGEGLQQAFGEAEVDINISPEAVRLGNYNYYVLRAAVAFDMGGGVVIDMLNVFYVSFQGNYMRSITFYVVGGEAEFQEILGMFSQI